MGRYHPPSARDDALFEALLKQGCSTEKAARIAHASALETLTHEGAPLENRTRDELYMQAQEIGIIGRSAMSKQELVEAIRKG